MHEIGFSECPKSYVFKGSKEYSGKQVQEMLGLSGIGVQRPQNPVRPGQPAASQAAGFTRFLQPVSECEFNMTSILEQLQLDPFHVANDKRPLRCTGTALAVGISLIEVKYYLSINGNRLRIKMLELVFYSFLEALQLKDLE